MTRSRNTANFGSRGGLVQMIPSSVTVGSGTGSSNTNGLVTFSGASSVSLNGCFTSTYENYRVIYKLVPSGDVGHYFRMRASGTDSSASYYGNLIYYYSNVSSVGNDYNNNISSFQIEGNYDGVNIIDIVSPYLAERTKVLGMRTSWSTTATRSIQGIMGGMHNVSSSYDGITFYPASGTVTGNISVYGYTQ